MSIVTSLKAESREFYILDTYAIFLFSQRHEELVGVYASQLAPYLYLELYVHMME